ncbi:hypothetical protein [Yersinia enterocolitica]|uniref:hypothetical protein n=2 Tax=Yersinia enterocolitica TaxID=630 RepID=UPI002DEE4C11|nr:hypothetical protein [Yersinia enterocolitica]EME3601618.1 hypothetical protein [Yersinia enterocolitica]
MSHFLKGLSADKFNQKYPVGSCFHYFSIKGIPDSVEVVTRTEAWALGHGDVVVSVNGRAGGLHIEHMKPVAVNKNIEGLISEPVAWTDADELADMASNTYGNIFNAKYIDIHNGRWFPLYSKEYVDSLVAQLEAENEKLLVPVKLPTDEIGEAASFMSATEVIPVSIVIELIKAAGYPVEGGSNDH